MNIGISKGPAARKLMTDSSLQQFSIHTVESNWTGILWDGHARAFSKVKRNRVMWGVMGHLRVFHCREATDEVEE